jgi:hypothetical protein
MPRLIHGWCVHCRGGLKVPLKDDGSMVGCPHCGREMSIAAATDYRRGVRRRNGWLWLSLAAVILLALGALVYWYRTPVLAGYDILLEETGSHAAAMVALVVSLALLVWAALWILLPIVFYIGLRDLRRRTADLDETMKLCARHLAALKERESERTRSR